MTVPLNKGSIFSNLSNQLKQIVEKKVFMRVVWSVLSGTNLYPVMREILYILARDKHDDIKELESEMVLHYK